MSKPENPPAFATASSASFQRGMTLRDWFAGQALTGLMRLCENDTPREGENVPQSLARKAYECADAMLAERERQS